MKISLILCVIVFAGLSTLSCSNVRSVNATAESDVLSLDDQRYTARANGDVDAMSRIYADDYTLITAEGALRAKSDQIDEMRAAQLKFNPIEIIDRTVRVYGDSAIVLAHEHSSIIRNGQEIGGNFRTSRIYVRRDGRWQLVHTQATRIAESTQ